MIDDSHAIIPSSHLTRTRSVVNSHERILDDLQDLRIALVFKPWEVFWPNQDGPDCWRSKHIAYPFIRCHRQSLIYLCIQPIWIDHREICCIAGAERHIAPGRRSNKACNDCGILAMAGLLEEWVREISNKCRGCQILSKCYLLILPRKFLLSHLDLGPIPWKPRENLLLLGSQRIP